MVPMPTVIDIKTIGTIIIFNRRINISPSGIKITEDSKAIDKINPKIIANII